MTETAQASLPIAPRPRVVVIGGGFAGVQVAQGLAGAAVEVVLVERRNFTLFQPLLYQVATGLLSPANIATPLRPLFRSESLVRVVLDEAVGFDPQRHVVHLRGSSETGGESAELTYDTLVVASGSRHHYFGHPEWEAHAPGLKTLEDAEAIRSRIFSALERAELTNDPVERERLLTFVVAGGGPTSVELVGALAEITRHTTRSEFRSIDPRTARIILVEAAERLLGGFAPASSAEAERALRSLGVEVLLSSRITGVDGQGVTLSAAAGSRSIAAATVLWGAGVRASPLGGLLATALGQTVDRSGRIVVEPDCTVPGHPEIFVLGDLAACTVEGRLLPGVAQVAIQQGQYVARVIRARLTGLKLAAFRYQDRGSMATIGRRLAVAEVGRLQLRGRLAWLAWLALHLIKLMRFESRMLVLLQWAWAYFTWNRSARLITGHDPDAPITR